MDRGEYEQALDLIKQVVGLYRRLIAHHPGWHRDHMAAALYTLSLALSGTGQHEAAAAVCEEATDVFRSLATQQPDQFHLASANSLLELTRLRAHEASKSPQ